MKLLWSIIAVLALASGVALFLRLDTSDNRPPSLDATPIDAGAPPAMAPDHQPQPLDRNRARPALPDRLIDSNWAMKRDRSDPNHAHNPNPYASEVPSLDELLGLNPLGAPPASADETTEEDEAAALKLLQALGAITLTGRGTHDDPYRASWELLDSARATFRPHEGLNQLPPNIEKLDGQTLTISGYFVAPWTRGEISELLLTRYVWDGCCIGVPPTAYTAVEVSLREPTTRRRLLESRTVSITGTFRIDPYEKRGWLLALYILEDAIIEPAP